MRRVVAAVALVLSALFTLSLAASAQGLGCEGYADQQGAQITLETDPSTAATLDPDGNGVACEGFDFSGDVSVTPPDVPPSGDLSTDSSGGSEVDNSSGDSGQSVGVPEPVAPAAPEAPAGPDTPVDSGDGAVADAPSADGATDTAELPAETADGSIPLAVAPTTGLAGQPVTSGAASTGAVASLPSTGAGPVAPAPGMPVTLLLLSAIGLLGAAGVRSVRRA